MSRGIIHPHGANGAIPTNRLIADGPTKDRQEPTDLLPTCIRQGAYQTSTKDTVLVTKIQVWTSEAESKGQQEQASVGE